MSNLTNTSYYKLLTAFLEAIKQPEAIQEMDPEEGIVEWNVGNLILRLLPHLLSEKEEELLEPDAIIIEADLMLLDLQNRDVNHDRFLVLHRLNTVSRVTTGIVAFITEEGILAINKILPLQDLDEEELSNQLAKVLEAGENLYKGWNELAELANSNRDEKEEAQIEKMEPFSIHNMA